MNTPPPLTPLEGENASNNSKIKERWERAKKEKVEREAYHSKNILSGLESVLVFPLNVCQVAGHHYTQ